ncbi:hypothetical protein BN439_2275 [Erwinia amylovora Ea644]|nr:hypothetical protein BN439_2275 [Erwinia amylovora Ea644]CCP07344.1 hypothetical protein BN440_2322 [Erwinia amylovora MR1]
MFKINHINAFALIFVLYYNNRSKVLTASLRVVAK